MGCPGVVEQFPALGDGHPVIAKELLQARLLDNTNFGGYIVQRDPPVRSGDSVADKTRPAGSSENRAQGSRGCPSVASRPIELNVQRAQHGKGVLAPDPELGA